MKDWMKKLSSFSTSGPGSPPGEMGSDPPGDQKPRGSVDIAIVGKYVNLKDSYKSLNEALIHGASPTVAG